MTSALAIDALMDQIRAVATHAGAACLTASRLNAAANYAPLPVAPPIASLHPPKVSEIPSEAQRVQLTARSGSELEYLL
jgi:hypothetical protein